MVAKHLENRGFETESSNELGSAVGRVSQFEPDLILLARDLPHGEDGLEWVKAFSSTLLLAEASVFLMSTTRPHGQVFEQAKQLGFVTLVPMISSRAVELEALTNALNETLRVEARPAGEPSQASEPSGQVSHPNRRGGGRKGKKGPARRARVTEKRTSYPAVIEEVDATQPRRGPRKPRRKGSPAPGKAGAPKASRPGPNQPPRLFEYERKGLASSGSLSDVCLAELLCSCHHASRKGRLRLRRGSVEKTIYLLGGFPVFVESNQLSETLGEQLRKQGRLSPDDHEKVLREMRLTGSKMGHVLLKHRLMSPPQLQSALSDNVQEKMLIAFSWTDGDYTLDRTTGFRDFNVSFSLTPPRIVIEGVTRQMELDTLFEHVPLEPRDCAYLRENELWESGEIGLNDREMRIQRQIAKMRPISVIAKKCDESPEYVMRLLFSLYFLELIGFEVGGGPPDKDSTPAPKKRITLVPFQKVKRPERKQIEAESVRLKACDFFGMLGVDSKTPSSMIHRAFRERIRQYQGDVLNELDDDERELAEQVQSRLTEAYLVLADSEQRDLYVQDVERLGAVEAMRNSRDVQSKASQPPPRKLVFMDPERRPDEDQHKEAEESNGRSVDAMALLLQAKKALDEGSPSEALEKMREAVRLEPGDPFLASWYAWATFSSDPDRKDTVSLSHLAKIAEDNPTLAEPFFFCARILEHQQDLDKARRFYRIVAGNPNASPATRKEAVQALKRIP